jgi:hypothetical protein
MYFLCFPNKNQPNVSSHMAPVKNIIHRRVEWAERVLNTSAV